MPICGSFIAWFIEAPLGTGRCLRDIGEISVIRETSEVRRGVVIEGLSKLRPGGGGHGTPES